MSYKDRITIEPGKRGGKPCIRGLRITIYDILSYLASGMSYDEILEDFPYLTREDILASLELQQIVKVQRYEQPPSTHEIEEILRQEYESVKDLERDPSKGILELF